MAAEQQYELVGNMKLEPVGQSVRVCRLDGSGDEVLVPASEADDFIAVFQEVADNAGK